jgi:hypothetical protein
MQLCVFTQCVRLLLIMYTAQAQSNHPLFAGRDHLLDEIAQGVLAPEPLSFSLVSAKLTGKSTFLRFLASTQGPLHNQSKVGERPACFYTGDCMIVTLIDCAWQAVGVDRFADVYGTVADQLQTGPCEIDWNSIEKQTDSIKRLWQLAHQLTQCKHRLVLLLDNFTMLLTPPAADSQQFNSLRRLMAEAALVVTTDQPLYDIDSSLAKTSLIDGFTQRFLGLLEPEAVEQWLASYQEQFLGLPQMLASLGEIAGRHPFLLRKLGDCLIEVQQMLPPQQKIGEEQLALLRLRLAEHARPLFMALWSTLQNPPAYIAPPTVIVLLERLSLAPLSAKQVEMDQFSTLNWLINQAVVMYRERNGLASYELFSPLFVEFLRSKLSIASTKQASVRTAITASELEAPIYEQLTKMEATLLRYFLHHSQSVVSTDQLLTEVWKRPDSSTRRVQEAIRRLRLQLEQQTPPIGIIENERGRGYRFVPAQQG